MKRPGPKGAAKTPAPKKERIKGSKANPKGSASKRGSKITFSDALTAKIKKKLAEYNRKNSSKKITLATAKKVVRRGMGAYSAGKSNDPTRKTTIYYERIYSSIYRIH
jgi:hypothetical protein